MAERTEESIHISKEVGERLRFERKIRKLSQEEMAFQLGISDRHLRRYEKGEAEMPILIFYHLYWDFGIDLNYLICGEFAEDSYVIRATATMPQVMVDKLIAPIVKTAENPMDFVRLSDEIVERDLKAFGIMASYGRYHGDEENIREPLCLPYFELYHIMFEKPFLPNDYMPDEEELEEVLQDLLKS